MTGNAANLSVCALQFRAETGVRQDNENGRKQPALIDTTTGPDGGGRLQPSSIDVARLAGVSQSAVSRAFTPGASVSKKTREKVIAAARELGYQPSILPRILVTHRSHLVAIVIGGMYNPYYAKIFEQFTRQFQAQGYQVLVFFVDHNEYFDAAIPLIMRYRVDGIISALSIMSREAADECAQMRIPVVLLNGRQQNKWVSAVCCDNVEGGRAVANLLFQKGGTRFAYIAGNETLANTDREQGFIGRLKELGVEDVEIAKGNFHYEGGYEAARILFAASNRPDAVFCANDLTAIGAMECARAEYGLRIPEDVMIAGFDDATFSSWPSYSLTTVRQNGPEMVDAAIAALKQRWQEGTASGGRLRLVPGTLCERKSTDRQIGS
ncbi:MULTISPECIES: LacI family DNA-binding transcriptional regulator [unclassified Mesorhizobium]|uniref:LacI family DNA-binding transcriptional regulator n=1 Tax=unclassified Mesorhizobium TaxID=325217 RepID=UPI000FC9B660|nr:MULTISPECIES: LacI family DNA-binding transcriptional regulator [unclassified Mesorhizobium]RUW32855.1 LacI family DNA-binding transcriptional regulator [Mesorhizobium sp. M1E.F.Ca.ET.041.01.1.1]RWD84915.1 MAG: LacI family DNA-binding transcriptional regulator [Mesorhizobium sp.]RWD90040.1 MAG: LacI family DNA-binding transcriptional regulator [Mesorhizobium sp.]TIV54165.1 MAG: LacI family DNA-binding transcriptional regulator [Mesorhizobium sp.]